MIHDKRPPTIETVRDVAKNGCVKIRFAEDSKPWTLDSFTASAMMACYNALNEANQAKIADMIRTKAGFMRYVSFCWKHVKPSGS